MLDHKNHNRLLLKQLQAKPSEIVAIAPSSRTLCDKMVEILRPNFGNIIKLGAEVQAEFKLNAKLIALVINNLSLHAYMSSEKP